MHIKESERTDIELTLDEARQLSALGQRLASKSTWWGVSNADEGKPPASLIRCRSDGLRGEITVHNAIGVVGVGDRRIVVRPKIDLPHVCHLLARGEILPSFIPSEIAIAPASDLLELIARWFVAACERLLRLGIVRDYEETSDDVTAILGRLEVHRTVDNYYAGRLAVHCVFDDFDLDTPLNRIVKAATRVVALGSAFSPPVRRRAAGASYRLEEAGVLRRQDLRVTLDRRTAHYGDVLMLARLILSGTSRTLELGKSSAWVFLIPTPLAVERGIQRYFGATAGSLSCVRRQASSVRRVEHQPRSAVRFGRRCRCKVQGLPLGVGPRRPLPSRSIRCGV